MLSAFLKSGIFSAFLILSCVLVDTSGESDEISMKKNLTHDRASAGARVLPECTPNGVTPCKMQHPNSKNPNPSGTSSSGSSGSKPESTTKTQPIPYALSATYLTYLARAELDIYKEMGDYANALEERLKLIRNYMRDYEDSTGKGTSHVSESADPWQKASQAAAHPLIAYRIVRRFAYEFSAIADNIGQYLESRMEEVILKLAGQHSWPSRRDNEDSMEAMLRLHYIYNLDLEKFTSGNLNGVVTKVSLPTHQIFQIAEYAIRNQYYSLARDWLQLTESKIRTDNNTGISVFAVANAYRRNTEFHDKNFEKNSEENHLYIFDTPLNGAGENATTVRETAMKTLPGTDAPPYLDEKEIDESIDEEEEEIVENLRNYEADHYTFLGLCSGENYQTEEYKKQLTCWYDSSRSAYFGPINPLKFELLNKNPMLLQIYEVIGDKWISKFIKKAMPTLQRAPLPDGPMVTYRTASYAWLPDEELEDTPISRRIELITQLNVRGPIASEALQIASYAYGGHVATHYDSLGLNPNETKLHVMGDRVTTFLIYLNDVQRGGYTAFPLLKTHVKPVKGSAVLWYTAMKNGAIDTRMLHGACPVILGHKWIATKWTNLNKNFLKRPCALDPNL